MTSSSNILWEEELKDMESGSLALPLQCHPSVEAHYKVSFFITVSIYVKSQFQFLLRHFCFLSMTGPLVTHSRRGTEFGSPIGAEKESGRPNPTGNCVFVLALAAKLSLFCREPSGFIPGTNWLQLTPRAQPDISPNQTVPLTYRPSADENIFTWLHYV